MKALGKTLTQEEARQVLGDQYPEPELIRPVSIDELLKMDMPPRKWLIEGLLQERDLSMVHSWRGVGKSRFIHGLIVALAAGGRFLRFSAPEPRGVMLVDGELPREDLQQMLAQAVSSSDWEPVAPVKIVNADLCGGTLFSLAKPDGWKQVEENMAGIDLLVFDSISTLCSGAGPENESDSWELIQAWLLDLRRKGKTVLLAHHDGKSMSQRGTSRREDVLSQVIHLKRPHDYRPAEGARFEVHFSKARGLMGDAVEPFEALLSAGPDGTDVWTWVPLERLRAKQMKELSDAGMSQRAIAQELGVSQATVCRALKTVREEL